MNTKNDIYKTCLYLITLAILLITSISYRYIFLMTSDYVLSLFYWVLCTALVFIPYHYIYNILSCGKNNIPLQGTTNESDEGKLTRPEYYPEDSTDVPFELPKPLRQICIVALLRALAKEQLIDANFKPYGEVNVSHMTYIADAITTIIPISKRWVVFEEFWNISNMKQIRINNNSRKCPISVHDRIISAFRLAAQECQALADSKAYHLWMKQNS